MPHPPVAPKIPKVDTLHGDIRQDDYFWLREKDNPDVLAYLRAENAHTDEVLGGTKAFQEVLYEEMLARIKEDDSSVPYRRGGHFYYSRTEKGKQYPIYCRKAGSLDAPEEITLDLNALAEGKPFFSLGMSTVSDDGNLLAYTTDITGFREYTLYIKDLRTDRLYPRTFENVSSVAWCADDMTLFYVTEDEAKRPYRLWCYRPGIMGNDLVHEEPDALFRIGVERSRSRKYLFLGTGSFTSSEWRYIPADDPSATWHMLMPREKDHEYAVDHGGDSFYIRTNGGGRRNFRLVSAPVSDPRPANFTELIPHREEVMLEDVEVFSTHYVTHEREQGLIRLRITQAGDGATHHVEFPEPTYEASADHNAEFVTRMYRFRYQSLITPGSVYDYDVQTRERTLLKQTPVLGGYDPTLYRSERFWATADDGTRVPISLVCKKETQRDGTAPMLLTGYGSYGAPYPVMFSSNRLSLLDRGYTIAIAHIRGGGEMGKRWHDAGRMMNKRNTFTDFIACAEHLKKEGYTATERLWIEGGSAGGLLIGAVLNLRPDLCRAAILRVPFVDVINTMLDESLPLTVGEFEEWGNPKIREQYEYMKTYCPYTNLAERAYPLTLVKTSLNDSQVMYWEPAKYVAKQRALNAGAPATLFKINLDAGHGGASGRYDYLREIAFDYAWVLKAIAVS
jgi:oligopeptidase B